MPNGFVCVFNISKSIATLPTKGDLYTYPTSSLQALEYNSLQSKTPATQAEINRTLYLGSYSGLQADFLLAFPVLSIHNRRGEF